MSSVFLIGLAVSLLAPSAPVVHSTSAPQVREVPTASPPPSHGPPGPRTWGTRSQHLAPELGAELVAMLPAERAAAGAPADRGVRITGVVPGGTASQAGLAAGDVLLEIDGQSITDPALAPRLVGARRLGETVRLRVVRGNQETTVHAVTTAGLGARPVPAGAPPTTSMAELGAFFRPFGLPYSGAPASPDPALQRELEGLRGRVAELERRLEALEGTRRHRQARR